MLWASSFLPSKVEQRERSVVIKSAQSRSAYGRELRVSPCEGEVQLLTFVP